MKSVVRYRADIDFEATIQKFQALRPNGTGYSFEVTGGRKRAGAQIVAVFKDWNVSVNIFHNGLIQVYYDNLVSLRRSFKILEENCVPSTELLTFVALDPDDPIDRSVELKTTYHFQNSDVRYAIATVIVYWWRNPETGEFIAKIPDRDMKLEAPKDPFVFDACVPVVIHVMDKFDGQGNKIIDAERLRRQGIEELKRIARDHSRVKFIDGRAVDSSSSGDSKK
jgi:hypothetical protein